MSNVPFLESTNVVPNIPKSLTSVPVNPANINLNNYFNYDPFDNSAFTDLLPGEELDFYLWVTHGENVSSIQNFYPIETKFQSLIFYSKPFQFILDEELILMFTQRPCKMLTGTCPIIPIENGYKKYAYLAPLVFNLSKDDSEYIQKMMGLYYFRLKKTANQLISATPQRLFVEIGHVEDECVIVKSEKILKYEDIYNLYNYDNITYSSIFKHVIDHTKSIGVSPDSVMLGIFSCQAKTQKYIDDYNQTNITNLIPMHVDTSFPHAEIIPNPSFTLENVKTHANNIYIIPTTFAPVNSPNVTSWSGALAGIKSQGCALNIFNFYGIIDTATAREQAVCLTVKGTSIFRVVDIINSLFIKSGIQNAYIILRCKLDYGCTILFNYVNYMKNIGAFLNNVLVFKLYKERLQNGKYSQIGHTVSIYGMNNKIYYIDPQNSILHDISELDNVGLLSFIQNLYGINIFKFMDIIFFSSITPPTTNSKYYSLYELLNTQPDTDVIERTEDINYGGKRNKSINKKKKTKMKYRKNKHNKTNKKYKQHGGVVDPYIKLVQETDKKNKVESLIMVDK
jgi:hypothetical protein